MDAATGIITIVAGSIGRQPSRLRRGRRPGHRRLAEPAPGVAVDAAGNLFIADDFNNRVRRVDATTGVITTVAGNGSSGYAGDGGPARPPP